MANYNYVGVACNFMLRKNYVLNYNPRLKKKSILVYGEFSRAICNQG